MATDDMSRPFTTAQPATTTNILTVTIAVIVGVVLLGAVFGATWPPGIGLVAIAALIALFVILIRGARAMNEPGNFGQGLTSVIAAVFLLPAAIGASVFLGAAVGVTDALDDFSPNDDAYMECLSDPDTTFEECEELQ